MGTVKFTMVVSWTSRLLRVFSDFSFFQIGSGAYGTPLPGRGGRSSRCLASAFGTQDPGFWDPKSRNGSLRAMRWSGSGGRIWSWWASHQPTGGQIMKRLTSTELFAPPGIRRKDQRARLERAKLVVAAARERAVETTQQRAAPSMKRFPTVLQRRRLAERLSANS